MNRNTTRLLAIALATAAAATCSAQTVIGTPRTFPIVIDQPGVYVLGGNLNVPSHTDGIKIFASNVVLDLNGFTLRGGVMCNVSCGAAGQTNGVTITGGNVTVRNGTIRGFARYGVQFQNTLALLEDLTITENAAAGVSRDGRPSFMNTESMPATLRRITAVRNGVQGISGYGMRIENTTLMQNFGVGMFSHGYNTYFDTLFMQNKTYGYAHASGIGTYDAMRNSRFQGNALGVTSQMIPSSMGGNIDDNRSGSF